MRTLKEKSCASEQATNSTKKPKPQRIPIRFRFRSRKGRACHVKAISIITPTFTVCARGAAAITRTARQCSYRIGKASLSTAVGNVFFMAFFVCLFVALLQSHCQGVPEGPPPNNASKLVLRLEELFSVLLMCVRMLRCTTQMVALFFCCLEARDRDITSRVVVIIYQKRANC